MNHLYIVIKNYLIRRKYHGLSGGNQYKKPNLEAIISGGAEVFRGLDNNITVNASLSYDPDVGPGDFTGMKFSWSIGHIGGNYSRLRPFSSDSFTAVDERDIHYSTRHTGRVIELNTALLLANKIYAVKLVVSKDDRNSTAFQIVHVVKGDPPEIRQR